MNVYIQKLGTEFANVNTFTACQGFIERGAHVEFFEADALDSLEISPETPVVGGIGTVHRALAKLGVEIPLMNAMPPKLSAFAGRQIWTATLREVRERIQSEGASVFIKPLPVQHKLFDGHVVSRFRDLIKTAGVAAQTPVRARKS